MPTPRSKSILSKSIDDGTSLESEKVSAKEIRTVLTSCIVGTCVEWYDFFLYGVAAGLVFDKLFFPSNDPVVGQLLAFATFAVGFVARPIGGLVFGHIGDRIGRKQTLVMTMLIMGIATFLIGCLPTHSQVGLAAPILLVVLRILQGAAIGGEWGGAVLMATEYAPANRKGLYGSAPQAGLAIGLMLGTGVFALLDRGLGDAAFLSWGWRIAFWLSAVLVIVGLIIRLKVMETPAFRKLEATEARATIPAVELMRSPLNRRHILLGMGARWIEGVAFNTFAVFSIAYATINLGLPRERSLVAVMVAALVLLVLIPVWGSISDRFDRRHVYGLGVVAAVVMPFLVFPMMDTKNTALLTAAIILALGVAYPIMYGPESSLFADLFPTSVRYSGISVVYQMSGIVASGLTPLILTWLLDKGGDSPHLIMGYFVVTGVISLACVLLVRRSDLDEIEAETHRAEVVSA